MARVAPDLRRRQRIILVMWALLVIAILGFFVIAHRDKRERERKQAQQQEEQRIQQERERRAEQQREREAERAEERRAHAVCQLVDSLTRVADSLTMGRRITRRRMRFLKKGDYPCALVTRALGRPDKEDTEGPTDSGWGTWTHVIETDLTYGDAVFDRLTYTGQPVPFLLYVDIDGEKIGYQTSWGPSG